MQTFAVSPAMGKTLEPYLLVVINTSINAPIYVDCNLIGLKLNNLYYSKSGGDKF